MARAKRLIINEDVIRDNLPSPPRGHHYRVEQFSKLVFRVMLVNDGTFSYKEDGEEVSSVHSFIKSTGDVMRPKSRDKISSEKVCPFAKLPLCNPYSVINDTHHVTSLQHL